MSQNQYDDDTYDEPDDSDDDNEAPQRDENVRLREAAKRGKKASKENDELRAKLAAYEHAELVRTANLDLNPKQTAALFKVHEGEQTPEAIRATAEALGFAQPDTTGDAEADAQRQLSEASAGAKVTGVEGQISADDFAGWDMPRKQDFLTRHPDKFEALKRGESVRV